MKMTDAALQRAAGVPGAQIRASLDAASNTRLVAAGLAPVDRQCIVCGREFNNVCSLCGITRYCGVDCQRAHWPSHSSACKVDRAAHATTETETFTVNGDCRHGGPEPSQALPIMLAAGQLAASPNASPIALERIASRLDGRVLADPRVATFLTSMAVDAFAANDARVALQFMQTVAFVEHRAGRRDAAAFAAMLGPDGVTSRTGLIRELRSRVPCGCLQPKPSVSAGHSRR